MSLSRRMRRTGAAPRKVVRSGSSGTKELAGFGAFAIHFCHFVFFYAPVQKTISRIARVRDISGQKPGIARFKLCPHSPIPVHEKFCVHVNVLYVPEIFERLRVFPFMEVNDINAKFTLMVVVGALALSQG
jgi:hypothetical protein